MSAGKLLQKAKRELRAVSPQAYQESLYMLSQALNKTANQIYLEDSPITPKQEKNFWQKVQQRKQAVPLEYILKEKFFFDHKFYIESPVFIPRPETETLVEWLCKNIPKNKALKFMDLGAGVGSIVLSLLRHFPKSRGTAVELYPKAIKCLKKNSAKLKDRLLILKKDTVHIQPEDLNHGFTTALHPCKNETSDRKGQSDFPIPAHSQTREAIQQEIKKPPQLDLITANPPYIDPKDKSIQPEVYLYESPLALFSDKKGLGHIMSWFDKAIPFLKPKGIYIFEFGWNQKEPMTSFLNQQPKLQSYKILKDQLGHSRIAVCFKK